MKPSTEEIRKTVEYAKKMGWIKFPKPALGWVKVPSGKMNRAMSGVSVCPDCAKSIVVYELDGVRRLGQHCVGEHQRCIGSGKIVIVSQV